MAQLRSGLWRWVSEGVPMKYLEDLKNLREKLSATFQENPSRKLDYIIFSIYSSPEVVPELDGLVEDGLVLVDLDGLVSEGREGRGRGEHGGGQHVAAPEPQGLGAEGEARAPPPPSSCARHCN